MPWVPASVIRLLVAGAVHAQAAPSGDVSMRSSAHVAARVDTTAVLDTAAVLRAVAWRAGANAQQGDSVLRGRCAAGEQPACGAVAPRPRYVLLAAPADTAYARLLRRPHEDVGVAAPETAPICPWASASDAYGQAPGPLVDTVHRPTGVRLSVQVLEDATPAAAAPGVTVVVSYHCRNPWTRRGFRSVTHYRVTRGPVGWTARAVASMVT